MTPEELTPEELEELDGLTEEEPTDPTEPADPDEPTEPDEPEDPAEPEEVTELALVKYRLNRLQSDTTLDAYLAARIAAARTELEATGIRLTGSQEDMLLVVDTAVWQYQNRDSAGSMPEWLRLRRRERWLQQRREAADDDS